MFCPICGEELKDQYQKFCHNCGSNISITPSQTMPDNVEEKPVIDSKTIQDNKNLSTSQPGFVGKEGNEIPYSKKCLAFSIASLIIVGFSIFHLMFIVLFHFISNHPTADATFLENIRYEYLDLLNIALNITGLIFGIVAKNKNNDAKTFERENTARKVGGILAILTIVGNLIVFIISLIFLPLFIFSRLS